ncbi:hypothetical protein [Streptomyces tendae]|uniref:hypothetical protein n=1 Tax=Streptomyces tendae TaxID=1932 RepID=UPI003D73A116
MGRAAREGVGSAHRWRCAGRLVAWPRPPRRRTCPECRREIAVVAGRYARHDPPGARESGELVSCPGSRRSAQLGAAQPSLDGYVVPDFPGQLPLF